MRVRFPLSLWDSRVLRSSPRDFAELFEGGFEIFADFLCENVGIGKIVGFFKAFISEPEDVEAGLVAIDSSAYSYTRQGNVKRLSTA